MDCRFEALAGSLLAYGLGIYTPPLKPHLGSCLDESGLEAPINLSNPNYSYPAVELGLGCASSVNGE